MDRDRSDPRALIAVLIALTCAAAAVVISATPLGVGVSPDSIAYLSTAEAISEGRGVVTMAGGAWLPLTHYPPLFPLVASIGSMLGIEPTIWIRGLHAVLFPVFVVMASLIVYRASGRSLIAAALTGGVLLASDDLVAAYCMAWSEPLFFALLMFFSGPLAHSWSVSRSRSSSTHRRIATSAFGMAEQNSQRS